MCNLNEVIAKSVELNNAIKKLNEETEILNSIVTEKRNARKEDIMNDLQRLVDIMSMLDIDVVELRTNSFMHYNQFERRLGIKIRRHSYGVQFDLGCCSTVMSGFYSYHSIGWVVSGMRNEEIMNGFCNSWSNIKNEIGTLFAEVVETILENRKEKAIADREQAINNLTEISR